ncbi:MBL fold metallo-hydrolase [Kribbella sandramycini]|uniref:Glyoxylase-like metal-dependent hydrolase (Beta-lactamase superfamily II) n=1 Tax=Kribbella sandramycini TaxID=60450 RepID=A0A7Y4L361_9ACTN|nr:MBL fold metallo-hydrolase [Kribbella sandramycini]MBB6571061.1 glyoxylase-like metal-dependent hydrolase (beta-lactamase superfamily II) [Kribbella sandramycini]NOL43530.1 MBL fold metallo-hydrolase [Kribbella sandramycini]
MRVHHLNCGSLRLLGTPLVCHVLLIETDADGLVLVDTGFGLADIANPARLGPARWLIRPALVEAETARRQVGALGFAASDVRHVVLTHFDLDHAGGLADFPEAAVHLTAAEARGAVHAPSLQERQRYRSAQWAHGPRLVEHPADGEPWNGFTAREILPGVALVPLPGHTRGHAAVAVDNGRLLHAGDAFFHRGTLDGSASPWQVRLNERGVAFDAALVRDNHARLAELHQLGTSSVFCAHDPVQFARLSGSADPA